jgi:hypothetical protein
MNIQITGSVPAVQDLEARFDFIKNQTLKTNLTIYLRYIIFLLALSEDSSSGSLRYSIYKDIIIHTASTIESTLEYAVKAYIQEGKAKQDVFGYSWHYSQLGIVTHDCGELANAQIVVQKKQSTYKTNGRDLGFDDINRAAKDVKIIDDKLFKMAEELRSKRNLIHLSSLEKSSDDYLKKTDVNKCLDDTKTILLAVEAKLNGLYS